MKYFLFPIAAIWHVCLKVRHFLYDKRILCSKKFDTPVICIGNLAMGGTGKTPHVMHIADLLKGTKRVGILSRGYGRATTGYLEAAEGLGFNELGDEPAQYLNCYKSDNVMIAVDEDRVEGIDTMLASDNPPEVILLDDAFQHRRVRAGFNVLLTDWRRLYSTDHLFPVGTLRDVRSAARRADVIVVTKCPKIFSPYVRRDIEEQIKLRNGQRLYFSYFEFGTPVPMNDAAREYDDKKISNVLLFTGVANAYTLEEYLKTKCSNLVAIEFKDHHVYQTKDIQRLAYEYSRFIGKNNVIVTTEKDSMRLVGSPDMEILKNAPLFYIPVKVCFHNTSEFGFDNEILKYVTENQRNS